MAGVSRRTEVIVNVIVCVGAAIVIFGAWAKILHKSFADVMLTVGLLTEAFIFLVYAFIPPPITNPDEPAPRKAAPPAGSDQVMKKLSDFLEGADLTSAGLEKLKAGFSKLSDTANKMADVSEVLKSTGEFASSTKAASDAMLQVRSAMGKTVEALDAFSQASDTTKQFHVQVQSLTKNLSSLNTIYELELQDSNSHLKAMNKYFGNLTAMADSMGASIEDAKKTQTEINQLASNLAKLNSVYGNMLNAMQGRV
jgi:gliding motility-associated protein GldL